jgi:hypothetical protein
MEVTMMKTSILPTITTNFLQTIGKIVNQITSLMSIISSAACAIQISI